MPFSRIFAANEAIAPESLNMYTYYMLHAQRLQEFNRDAGIPVDHAVMSYRFDLSAVLPWMLFLVVFLISFVVQPAKFLTPNVSKLQLVEVGVVLFRLSHILQFILFVIALAVPQKVLEPWTARAILIAAIVILCLQHFNVLPILVERLQLLKLGAAVPTTWSHSIYILLEVTKLSLIAGYGLLPKALR